MAARLSVTILTKNNARTLDSVLSSVQFADELIVVDSGSDDETLAIARRHGARIEEHPIQDFATQRNLAWRLAAGHWVLALDSDEILDPEIAAHIQEVTQAPGGPGQPVGYELRVQNYFLGRPLVGGGLANDFHLRLAVRESSRWEGEIHERLTVVGLVARLRGRIEHHTSDSLESRFAKTLRYARARARQMRARGERVGPVAAVYRALRFFFGRLFVRAGYRDGFRGVVWWWLLATELLFSCFLSSGAEEDGGPAEGE